MAFATPVEVAARLGRSFDASENTQATQILEQATQNIAFEVDKDADWITATESAIPGPLNSLCIEICARVMVNPNLLQSYDQRLGEYELQASWPRGGNSGTMLTQAEVLLARRVVWGVNSDTSNPNVHADDILITERNLRGPLPQLGRDLSDPTGFLGGDYGP